MKRLIGFRCISVFFFSCFLTSTILLFSAAVYGQCPPVVTSCSVNPRVKKLNANISPRIQSYMEYLPTGYNPNAPEKYPVLIYWAGLCEILENGAVGSQALCNILNIALPKLVNEGSFPEVVTHNGQNYSYIVIAPLMNAIAGINNVVESNALIDYLIQNYRIDTRRIYSTGISFGSYLLMDHASSSVPNGQKMAAINPMANCFPDTMVSFSSKLANLRNANVHVWGIQCVDDWVCDDAWIQAWVNGINATNPGFAQYTLVNECAGFHPVWGLSYNPTFRVNGKNIYEWLIQYQSNYVVYRQISSNATTGAWDNPATWSCNCIPQFDDEVTIKTGQTVNITPAMGAIQVRKLTQQPGSTFNVSGSFKVNPN